MPAVVRDADPERDFAAIAELLTRHGAERVEEWELREEHERVVEGKLLRRFVAERGGIVAGVATCVRYPSQPAGLYHVHIVAEPEGKGTGRVLARRLCELLEAEPVEELWVDVRDDRPRGFSFARLQGFSVRARQVKATLDLRDWQRPEETARGAHLEAEGIRLLDFGETRGDSGALRALYEINRVAGLDDPSSAGGFPPYETWLGIVPRSAGFDPHGQILAENGGRFVGLAAVGSSGGQAWNSITGVDPAFRRRGIARALKILAAEHAQRLGVAMLETEMSATNEAMRALNRSLGYREQPGYRTLSRRPRD